jgi:NAD(P)-dependent dehydrogenase (short-subunit alcohol dehydrogenase family)
MDIRNRVAVITGAGGGIGRAVAASLAKLGVKGIALVDRTDAVNQVADQLNGERGARIARPFVGDATSGGFRRQVFDAITREYGPVGICVPAAGITRDALAVKVDKQTGKAALYPEDRFREVLEVNLAAPVYWALEMLGRIAEHRFQRGVGKWSPQEPMEGTIIFIGSVSSQGNKGQVAYAATKKGLEGAAATLMKEGIFHGVRCAVIHPGFTDTPMVRALGEDYINQYILPYTQLGRLIRPDEIADAICFMISNSAVSGELWADAGWHPSK